nr:protein-L-isoaspartate(D-aspartate) O-methyltransferase [Cytophagales bacterium]
MANGAVDIGETERQRALRDALVVSILDKGIDSPGVLAAIASVPRHCFVPPGTSDEDAYADHALPIGEGQTISQPYTVAYQTQLLDVQAGQRILEIGTGSGYQAAVLCYWPVTLFSVERNETLYRHAQQVLRQLGYSVYQVLGDGSQGLPAHAPFDRILVTAGAPAVPDVLLRQLAVGGKIVIPVG